MTIYARKKCICNSKKPHFCPPCFGEEGFYACDVEDISSYVAELKENVKSISAVKNETISGLHKRIAKLEVTVKDKEEAGIFGMAYLTKRAGELEGQLKACQELREDYKKVVAGLRVALKGVKND